MELIAVTWIVAITEDPIVLRGLERVAAALGAHLATFKSLDAATIALAPTAIVVDAEAAGTTPQIVGQLKTAWPGTLIAGFVSNPSRTFWERAEAAGLHLVATRGGLAAQLQKKLKDWQSEPGQRRVRVCDLADLAGRLGVVARLDDVPGGPLAVYHFGGKVYAAQDECPHAGGRLSEGTLEGPVVTCPRHGSQFNFCTGERLRGPADVGIKTYPVVIEGAQVFLVVD